MKWGSKGLLTQHCIYCTKLEKGTQRILISYSNSWRVVLLTVFALDTVIYLSSRATMPILDFWINVCNNSTLITKTILTSSTDLPALYWHNDQQEVGNRICMVATHNQGESKKNVKRKTAEQYLEIDVQ